MDSQNAGNIRKIKGKIPDKTTMNLMVKVENNGQSVFTTVAVLLFLVIVAVFAHYVVRKQLAGIDQARILYESYSEQLQDLQAANVDYDEVVSDYNHYGNSYLNEDETALQNRIKILEVINSRVSHTESLTQITVSGNTVTATVISDNLRELSDMVQILEKSEIVSYVNLNTASLGDKTSETLQELNLIQGTLTIEFTSATGTSSEEETGDDNLIDELAERKAEAEATGEDYE